MTTNNTEKPLTQNMRPDGSFLDLRAYEQAGGYQAIRKVLSGGMEPKAVTDEVKDANLRGRGGAGFQTGLKWSFVPLGKDAPNPTYLVVNGDEMEPGTFKDRLLLERDPHQLIEGVIVAGFDANKVFIENGRYHGDKIVARVLGTGAPPEPKLSAELDT